MKSPLQSRRSRCGPHISPDRMKGPERSNSASFHIFELTSLSIRARTWGEIDCEFETWLPISEPCENIMKKDKQEISHCTSHNLQKLTQLFCLFSNFTESPDNPWLHGNPIHRVPTWLFTKLTLRKWLEISRYSTINSDSVTDFSSCKFRIVGENLCPLCDCPPVSSGGHEPRASSMHSLWQFCFFTRILASKLALEAKCPQKIDADHTFTTHKCFFSTGCDEVPVLRTDTLLDKYSLAGFLNQTFWPFSCPNCPSVQHVSWTSVLSRNQTKIWRTLGRCRRVMQLSDQTSSCCSNQRTHKVPHLRTDHGMHIDMDTATVKMSAKIVPLFTLTPFTKKTIHTLSEFQIPDFFNNTLNFKDRVCLFWLALSNVRSCDRVQITGDSAWKEKHTHNTWFITLGSSLSHCLI